MPQPEFDRILITGAAGNLGAHLRRGLAPLARVLRLTDLRDLGEAAPNEELVTGDLSDRATAMAAIEGCDAIVHFAAHPREITFAELQGEAIPAAYHVWEGARLHGIRRVVYASSIHAVGFHAVDGVPGVEARHRPDSFYGLAKTFSEDLASLYWDKYGVETVSLRICSCFEEPRDRRMLWSWLSFADMVRLTAAALTAPRVGFSAIYGTSANAEAGVSNAGAAHIGFRPQDSADPFAEGVRARTDRPDPNSPAARVVGGAFAAFPHPDDA